MTESLSPRWPRIAFSTSLLFLAGYGFGNIAAKLVAVLIG